jgi:hypothetical protein
VVDISKIDASLLGETKISLERIQSFNPESMIRREDLGKYAFDEAVVPAKRLIELFSILPISYLIYFPDQQLVQIKDVANSTFSSFQSFLEFDLESGQQSVTQAQESMVRSLQDQYQHVFNVLSPLISFSTARAQDFSALERQARTAAQSAQDQAAAIVKTLEDDKRTIEGILKDARDAAAEQGVGKQAIHFKQEADKHQDQAKIWLERSVWTAIGLGAFAIFSLFLHNFPGLGSTDPYRMAQIAVSKVLIFGVIAYMLLLCARNFLSHKHNEVINRHRQNALATFTALVDATSDAASSDIVLSHAASCIFSPQETGYAKQEGHHGDSVPALQLLPRIAQASQ